jgi:hypothetical protein
VAVAGLKQSAQAFDDYQEAIDSAQRAYYNYQDWEDELAALDRFNAYETLKKLGVE